MQTEILDPTLKHFLNLTFRKPWIIRDFMSKACSLRRKYSIMDQLEPFGVRSQFTLPERRARTISSYGYMLHESANELLMHFGGKTLFLLKEYGQQNLKLEILCALLSDDQRVLGEIKRAYPRRLYRALERLLNLELIEKTEHEIAISDKGARFAQTLCNLEKEMAEGTFLVSSVLRFDPGTDRFYDGRSDKVDVQGLDELTKHLDALWKNWPKNGNQRRYHWLSIAFPSPLKRLFRFRARWQRTGLEVFLHMHEFSEDYLFNSYRDHLPEIPLFIDEVLKARLINSTDERVPICGIGLTCNLDYWWPRAKIETLEKYLWILQDNSYCNTLSEKINEVVKLLRRQDDAPNLSSINADLHLLKLRYITDSPIEFYSFHGRAYLGWTYHE